MLHYIKHVLITLCIFVVLGLLITGTFLTMDLLHAYFKQNFPLQNTLLLTMIAWSVIVSVFMGILQAWLAKKTWAKRTITFLGP